MTNYHRYIAIISGLETEEAKSLILLKPKINGLKQYVRSNWGGQHTSLSVSIFGIDYLGNRFAIH
jgi:hypothetical protein